MPNPLTRPITLPWDGAMRKAASLLMGRQAGGMTPGLQWGTPLWGSWRTSKVFDYRAAVGDPLGNSIVVACLNAIAQAAPEPLPRVYQIEPDGEDTALPQHPLQGLLRRPNPFMSWELLMGYMVYATHLDGNAYLWKNRSAAGRAVELWPLHPSCIEPAWPGNADTRQWITHYDYKPSQDIRDPIRLDPKDVVHLRLNMDPNNMRKGRSPLWAAFKQLFTDEEAASFTGAMLRNFGVPGVILSPNPTALGSGGGPGEDDVRRVKEQYRQSFGGENRGEPMVTGGPFNVNVVSFSPQQMNLDKLQLMPEARVCLVPGTEIMTKRGLVPIEEVGPGDEVVTHRGRWRRVTERYVNDSAGRPMVEVQANGFAPLRCTADHPVYAASFRQTRTHGGDLLAFRWEGAGALRPRRRGHRGHFDALTMPMLVTPETSAPPMVFLPDHIPATRVSTAVTDGRLVHAMPHVRSLPATVVLSPALGRLLGYFLAEGSTGSGRVYWYFAKHETAYRTQVLTDLREVFGLEGVLKETRTTTAVVVQSVFLAKFLACGTARTKRVPSWAWDGDDDFRAAVLEAWADGDGHRIHDRVDVTTRSRDLAWGMRLLALSVGHVACLVSQKRGPVVLEGRTLPGGINYTVRWHTSRAQPTRYAIVGHQFVSYVRSVEPLAYDGPVYNLEVEEDHSYLTTGGMVHNCALLGVPPIVAGLMVGMEHCIVRNMRIATVDRGPVCADEVRAGERVWALGPEGMAPALVTWSGKTGHRPVYRVKTKNRTVTATDNHPFLVRRQGKVPGRRGPEWKFRLEWVPLRSLVVGDTIVSAVALPDVGGTALPDGTPAAIGLLEWCGAFVGDGHYLGGAKDVGLGLSIPQQDRVREHYAALSAGLFTRYAGGGERPWKRAADGLTPLMVERRQQGETYAAIAADYGMNKASVRARIEGALHPRPAKTAPVAITEGRNGFRIGTVAGSRWVRSLGFVRGAREKGIPAWVFGLAEEFRLAFLRGLLDTDGTVDKRGHAVFTFASERLTEDTWHLALSLGMAVTNIYARRQAASRLPQPGLQEEYAAWSFTLSSRDDVARIGTHDLKYQAYLAASTEKKQAPSVGGYPTSASLLPPRCAFVKVQSIEPAGTEDVYDLTVEGVHNFIANGLVIHNSTYNNTSGLREHFTESKLVPFWRSIEGQLSHSLIPDFGDPNRLRIAFDLSDVRALQEDMDSRYARVTAFMLAGGMLMNEARQELGMAPLPDGDVLYMLNTHTVIDPADLLAPPEPMPLPATQPAALLEDGSTPPVPAKMPQATVAAA